jgi:hypothetical protein
MARKPKLPIGDDLARLLKLALAGAKGPAKKTQANRIVSKLESKGNPAVSGMRTKAGKMEQQLVRGKVKRREVESISADADKHMQRMAKQGKNWDGSPVKKATKPRKAASKKLTVAEEIAAARRILAQREMGKKVIKAQERTLRATRLGDAAATKGTKKGRGGKEIPMSKKEVKKVVRQGNLAGSQRAKGNATKKATQMNLQARMQNAPDAASKRAARNKLRKHQDTHGNFLG